MLRRGAILSTSAGLVLSVLPLGSAARAAGAADATSLTSRFVAFAPTRVLDTRTGGSAVAGGGVVTVVVAGRPGVPANASAVVLNVTATETTGPGFVTVWPTGVPRPVASNLNIERADQTVANLVISPVATSGSVDVFAQRATHVVVDLLGAFVPAGTATAGRLVATRPQRVLDTRATTAFAADEVRVADLGPSARDASAAIVNLTAVDASGPGFFTAWAAGTTRPSTSNVNVDHVGQTIANLAIVGVSSGKIAVSSHAPAHLVIDLVGVFTSATAPSGNDGLFVPLAPTRVLDTRQHLGGSRLTGGHRSDVTVAGNAGIPTTGVGAVVLNATTTETSLPGYVTVYPRGTAQPLASNLNAEHSWQTVANLVVAPLGSGGGVSFVGQHTGHIVADVAGWFTGSSQATDPGVPLDAPAAPLPSSNGALVLTGEIGGNISPKSVVATGGGLVFAQNMIYSHAITVYDRAGGLAATIPDTVGQLRGGPVEAAVAADGRSVYVSNYSMYGPGAGPAGFDACQPGDAIADSTVFRIDIGTLTIDDVIGVGRVPKFLATSPDGRWLVVSNWCGDDVSIVDTATARELRRVHVGRYPRGIAIAPDSSRAYIALMGEGRIAVVDLAEGSAAGSASNSVPTTGRIGGGTRHLNLSKDGRWLYVTLNEDGGVAKVDTSTLTVVARVSTGSEPRSAALSADGAHLYVVNYESTSASKIRTSDLVVEQTVSTAHHPIGITYDDETGQLFVACYDGRILLFNEQNS